MPTLADPAAGAWQDYVFFEHTFSRSRPGADPDRAFTGGGLNVIPSYVAVRSRTALLVRNDLDRRWGRHRYAYEFYDYTPRRWERTNQYDDPAHAAEVATLMAKLDQWDACAHLRRRRAGARHVSLADGGVAARLTGARAPGGRGRPPRLLHVEPRAPGRLRDRRAARRRPARRGDGRSGARSHARRALARPGHADEPADFAVGREVLLAGTVPVLGVCLGMQGLVTAYGGVVDRVAPAHGDLTSVTHDGRGVFAGVPQDFKAVRYHSLAALSVPAELVVTAHGDDGTVMGVRHRSLPLEGVQFHPESVLSEHGALLVANFLGVSRG